MAKTVSPGVFTEERDQSFLTQGVEQIGGGFVGPTAKGPAYEPVTVESPNEYIQTFGNGGFYTDRAVIEYLREAGQATVVRILGGSPSAREEGVAGYVSDTYELRLDSGTDLDGVTASVLAPTKEGGNIDTINISGDFRSFQLDISFTTGGSKTYMLSLDPADKNYIKEVFGKDPRGFTELYAAGDFEEFHDEVIERYEEGDPLPTLTLTRVDEGANFDNLAFDHGKTPWVMSQDLLEEQPSMTEKFPLFRIHNLSDGTDSNRDIKVAVENIRLPSEVPGDNYGRFDLVVRGFEDTDANPDVIETFTDLTLEPGQPNYVARAIGNRKTTYTESGAIKIDGAYDNISNFIRIEMNQDIVAANEDGRDDRAGLVPWGFQGYQYPYETDGATLPAGIKYRETQAVEDYEYDVDLSSTGDGAGEWAQQGSVDRPFDTGIYHGFDFSYDYNVTWLAPLSEADDVFVSDGFNFSDIYEDSTSAKREDPSTGDRLGTSQAERKFIMGLQGGFDGKDPTKTINKGEDITATNTQGFDASTFNTAGTLAYRDAFGILSNEDSVDINLLVTPGIIKSLHPSVVEGGISLVEDRGDSFYVFDVVGPDASLQAATEATSDVNTNYAGTYYPWLRTLDSTTNRIVKVPPSALIPRVYAFNDNVGFEWSAPAGNTRGVMGSARETVVRLNQDQRDTLYSARVNPIAQYEGDVVVWGQKTLQALPSALDRIKVRRLLLRVKKFIASSARFLVFEPNNTDTRAQFRDLVVPFMDRVQQQGGVQNYRIQMDEENNPPEVRDRNILRGKIGIQPTPTAEFLDLTFTVLPSGAEFPGDGG